MPMHFAKLENSPRLQRTLTLLKDGQWHTTRNIVLAADVCAVNSIITELRKNGFSIDSRQVKGQRGWYEYRLAEAA